MLPMNRSTLAVCALLLLACSATRAPAQQVGYPPTKSPYQDLTYGQELSAFSGWYGGSVGQARVGPRAAPLLGLRYEVHIGGPAQFTAQLARVFSERTVLDPRQPVATRNLGLRSWPFYLADVGLSLNLTGRKSWHSLVPVVGAGVGIASDLGKRGDPGAYKFGTPFAFSFGGGLRWTHGGPLMLRADAADHLYQLHYPDTYFLPPANVPAVLPTRAARAEYTHNLALTIGASYLFFR